MVFYGYWAGLRKRDAPVVKGFNVFICFCQAGERLVMTCQTLKMGGCNSSYLTKTKIKKQLTVKCPFLKLRMTEPQNQNCQPLKFRKKHKRVGFSSFCESGLNERFLDAHVCLLVEHVLG